ncbi:MAG: ParB/Srx family N-terminal domain-containing protein [Pseudomonadota bacterium]
MDRIDTPPGHDLAIEHRTIASLRPWRRNARIHPNKQIGQIADSIDMFGFTSPVLIDAEGTILAGHGRVAATKRLALKTVPCVRPEHMSEAQKRAYVLADTMLALNAGWDDDAVQVACGCAPSITAKAAK